MLFRSLFLRFEGGLTIHSHLRLTGSWGTYASGARWRRGAHRAWLIVSRGGHDVVEFDGPVLELLTDARARNDPRIALLGPDIIAPDFDPAQVLRRLREDDPTRPVGDALLDQRSVAGIGNLWKCEACWEAQIDPWRATAMTSNDEILALLSAVRPRMQASAAHGMTSRDNRVYGRAGRPCRRCETSIAVRGQGDGNRPTYWCPGCQR